MPNTTAVPRIVIRRGATLNWRRPIPHPAGGGGRAPGVARPVVQRACRCCRSRRKPTTEASGFISPDARAQGTRTGESDRRWKASPNPLPTAWRWSLRYEHGISSRAPPAGDGSTGEYRQPEPAQSSDTAAPDGAAPALLEVRARFMCRDDLQCYNAAVLARARRPWSTPGTAPPAASASSIWRVGKPPLSFSPTASALFPVGAAGHPQRAPRRLGRTAGPVGWPGAG